MIQTLDFFTPVVDDPYIFGQIAATNSLSDVYAMGGTPLTAMNIVCFPSCLPIEILGEILKGGADKINEAGALLVGGHTVEDDEPKYGLSVSGLVEPNKVLTNSGARVGDVLLLTKPVGLGVLNTAVKADIATSEQASEAINTMITLNKYAIEAIRHLNISACTDITGFGFIGHAFEIAKGSGVSLEIDSCSVPLLTGAMELAAMGIIPAGMYANKKHVESKVKELNTVDTAIMDLLYDPQTSGGLLIAISEEDLKEASMLLSQAARNPWAVVGRVVEKGDYSIYIK